MVTPSLPLPIDTTKIPNFACPTGTKMHILDLGHLQADEAWMLRGANGSTFSNLNPQNKRRDLICLAALIEYPGFGCILFETGCAEEFDAQRGPAGADVFPRTSYTEEQKLPAAIKATGNDIRDVKAVVFGHLHCDHAGGLEHFVGTDVPIYVHEEEYGFSSGRYVPPISLPDGFKHACWAVATDADPGAYLPDYLHLQGLKWKTFNHESMVLCQGITLYLSPGHTPGLCIMQVNLENDGTFIWTTDQFHVAENYEMCHPQGWLARDHNEWVRSTEMIRRLQRTFNATMIFGHDKPVAERLMGRVYT